MVLGRGTWFVRVEARDFNHYWITCQVDNTGVKFMTQVNWHLVIDPDPQDMLSWLDWVGSLIWLWWVHLVHQSWRMQYWWLGREMRGRGKHREGPSGMGSEGKGYGISRLIGQHHHLENHPFYDFMDEWVSVSTLGISMGSEFEVTLCLNDVWFCIWLGPFDCIQDVNAVWFLHVKWHMMALFK